MAQNKLPKKLSHLFTRAEDMAGGAHEHELAIGLKQNKEADIRADLLTAVQAVEALRLAKLNQTNAVSTQNIADSNGKGFIQTARGLFNPIFGPKFNTSWGSAGFPNQSTAVPRKIAERQVLLRSLTLFLTANATYEVDTPVTIFTGARAQLRTDNLNSARANLQNQIANVTQKQAELRLAVVGLRKRMRGLISELDQLLPADSPLWYAFGLVPPGGVETPATPKKPTLTLAAGAILANWPAEPRADHYRVFWKLQGTLPATIQSQSVDDPDATIDNPGAGTWEVWVSAVNAAGESGPSEKATIGVS